MDSPASVAFTGLLARYGEQIAFESAPVVVRNVTVHNPPGIYDPVKPESKFIAFAFYSLDGKPLADTAKASLSIVSTSFNTGFTLNGDGGHTTTTRGDLPVLVARVEATIESTAIDGMKYTLYDWHMQPIGEGSVSGGKLHVPADQPVFVVELRRATGS